MHVESIASGVSRWEHVPMNYANTCFVKAHHGNPDVGNIEEGFPEVAEAIRRARALAENAQYTDVVLIMMDGHEAIVHVLKGVEWFCQKQLSTHYPGWQRQCRPIGSDS